MRILLAGASGLVGSALYPRLLAEGHEVIRLVRGRPAAKGELAWAPERRELDPAAVAEVDAAINLAGASIAGGRWTEGRRALMRESRIGTTATLVQAFAASKRPRVLINASAVGYYGDCGDALLTEHSAAGGGFLARLCVDWEAAAMAAASQGTRVVLLRLGLVLSGQGGVVAAMAPFYRLGLGGPLGDGQQWLGWIAREDLLSVICGVLQDEAYEGPVNVVAPEPVRNIDFSAILAAVLKRPGILRVPAWALRLRYGRMADETLLASQRVFPAALQHQGFMHHMPDLPSALLDTLD